MAFALNFGKTVHISQGKIGAKKKNHHLHFSL